MKLKTLLNSSLITVCCLIMTPIHAQIDGSEDLCIDLQGEGAAYGLCNAYCNAMKCHLANDGSDDTNPNANERACARVADNFLKHSSDGAVLPCEEAPPVPCPDYVSQACFDARDSAASNAEGICFANFGGTTEVTGVQYTITTTFCRADVTVTCTDPAKNVQEIPTQIDSADFSDNPLTEDELASCQALF